MVVRLNGWQRLWIVLCALYAVPVATVLYLFWPTPEQIHHREGFVSRMPAHFQKLVITVYPGEYAKGEAWKLLGEKGKKVTVEALDILNAGLILLPNGAILAVRAQTNRTSQTDIARAYWAVVRAEARAERWTMAWWLALEWLVPCLTVYAVGWATAWVRRGFKNGASGRTCAPPQ
jgi:hypothetical protein